jgi:hypothetical protein
MYYIPTIARYDWNYKKNIIFVLEMKQTNAIQKVAIRFRRWSRGGYAAFASLGKNVTIGCLSAEISDVSLLKQIALCQDLLPLNRNEREEEEEKRQEALAILQQEMIFTVNEISVAAAQALVANTYDINGYMRISSCSRFFIF